MATRPKQHSRKRLATRQRISDTATRLFFEHGFDQVTVDQIAAAADVSRMTVFNHFARKEDMFFDLDEAARNDLLAALEHRPAHTSPLEALRRFAHSVVEERRLYANFFDPNSGRFMATVQASEALKARARAIRDELSDLLATALARSIGRQLPEPAASLAAAMLLATWTVALTEGHRTYREHRDVNAAKEIFFQLIDRGALGVQAALHGTPFV